MAYPRLASVTAVSRTISHREYRLRRANAIVNVSRYSASGNTQSSGTGATSSVRWFVVASNKTEPQADRASHKIQTYRGIELCSPESLTEAASTCASGGAGDSTNASRRLDIQAAIEHTATNTAYSVDHNCACRCEDMRGSIRKGKLSSATNEAKFEIANRWYA